MRENEGFLSKIPIFSNLDENVITSIEKLGHIKKLKKDSVIIFEKQEGTSLIFVIKGSIKLSKMNEEGSEVTIDIVEENNYWGEIGVIDGLSPTVNVSTNEDSELFIINSSEFFALLKNNPEISLALINNIARQLRSARLKIESLSLKAAEGKVAFELMRLVESSGLIKNGSIEIENIPDQQVMADMAGTSRETISRTLHSFSKKGVIQIDGPKLRIVDFEKLKELNH